MMVPEPPPAPSEPEPTPLPELPKPPADEEPEEPEEPEEEGIDEETKKELKTANFLLAKALESPEQQAEQILESVECRC